MAYLKGGSYVDGDLIVSSSLRVNNVSTINGNKFPYIDGNVSEVTNSYDGFENRLVVFSNDQGGLTKSVLEIDDKATGTDELQRTISIKAISDIAKVSGIEILSDKDSALLHIDAVNGKLQVINNDISLNEDKWTFS